jgi:hypothetical protein
MQEVLDRATSTRYWSFGRNNKKCTLYFHTADLRIKMASIDSRYEEIPIKLLKDLETSTTNIEDETGDRMFVLMRTLPSTSHSKMRLLIELVQTLDPVDVYYWAWKFGNENQNVVASALRKLFRL